MTGKTTRYTHEVHFALDVESDDPDGLDITAADLREAITQRLDYLRDDELIEDALPPETSHLTNAQDD